MLRDAISSSLCSTNIVNSLDMEAMKFSTPVEGDIGYEVIILHPPIKKPNPAATDPFIKCIDSLSVAIGLGSLGVFPSTNFLP